METPINGITDNEFSEFCKYTLEHHSNIIEGWLNSSNPVKKALGKLVVEEGGKV